jgi:RNA polymerase sigma-70 factor (ECF subfamily)
MVGALAPPPAGPIRMNPTRPARDQLQDMLGTDVAPSPVPPAELLAAARAGDPAAFATLIVPLQGRLWRQATALCGDPTAAEDLVQQTLLEAWTSLSRYDASRPVPLAHLTGADAAAGGRRVQELPDAAASPAETADRHEQNRRLRQQVDTLPEPHRRVILLRFFEDASLQEIAGVLRCSVGTVKSRLHYALARLRRLNLPHPGGDT